MELFNNDLNKVALSMGKIIKVLSQVEGKIKNGNDVYANKESFYVTAYMCRVGLLDIIEHNKWPLTIPITIPLGLLKTKKTSLASGLELTIGKLKQIIEIDIVTTDYVENILQKGGFFYEFQRMIPEEQKKLLF